jgi:serine/threonine-protein kinase SRPK3
VLFIATNGKFANEIFNRKGNTLFQSNIKGDLRNIQKLRFWKLEDVLVDKYHFSRADASECADFLLPCLEINQKKRASASMLLKSDWLKGVAD